MRISRFVTILAAAVVAFSAPSLTAQVVGAIFASGGGIGASAGVIGAPRKPYTESWTQTSVQTLANGTTITRQSSGKIAIDSTGKTYMEDHHTLPAGPDGQPREFVTYFVHDPAARTSLNWTSNSKEATLFHQEPPREQKLSAAPRAEGDAAPAIAQRPQQMLRTRPEIQHEDLGTKTIAGVTTTGVRTTRIIPAGAEGNDQPLTITDETWRSTEYGQVLLSIHDDPRNGKSTREVTEFLPGEPDTALFQAPEGYTVKEVSQHRATPLE